MLYREAESYVSHHQQANIKARASVQYPILTVKQIALLERRESLHIKFENRRLIVVRLNQPQSMSAKMAANGV